MPDLRGSRWSSRRARYLAGSLLILAASASTVLIMRVARTYSAPDCIGAQSIEMGCFATRYKVLTQNAGADAALADLAERRQSNDYLSAVCHKLTHVIGRAAGEIHGKRAFMQGSDLCASGYYHGIVEAVMTKIGPAEILDRAATVCGDQRERMPNSYLHYNCVHGMGHGFMAVFESDIFRSLAGCDSLADEWEQRHCYGGVFMQNLSALGDASGPSNLRPSEPLYPCTAVEARHKGECYMEQTAYALFVRNDDYSAVFTLCREEADRDFRTVCYEGLGGDAAIHAGKYILGARARAEAVGKLCSLGPDDEARSHCVIGAVTTIVRDRSGDDTQAREVCVAMRDERLTAVCETARAAEIRAFASARGVHHHD